MLNKAFIALVVLFSFSASAVDYRSYVLILPGSDYISYQGLYDGLGFSLAHEFKKAKYKSSYPCHLKANKKIRQICSANVAKLSQNELKLIGLQKVPDLFIIISMLFF